MPANLIFRGHCISCSCSFLGLNSRCPDHRRCIASSHNVESMGSQCAHTSPGIYMCHSAHLQHNIPTKLTHRILFSCNKSRLHCVGESFQAHNGMNCTCSTQCSIVPCLQLHNARPYTGRVLHRVRGSSVEGTHSLRKFSLSGSRWPCHPDRTRNLRKWFRGHCPRVNNAPDTGKCRIGFSAHNT
jgi:hypothetical protein